MPVRVVYSRRRGTRRGGSRLVAAALGYLLSVVANFTTVPIGLAAGKFKGRLIERSKTRALQAYKEVRALHDGTRDKYIYAIHSWGFVIAYLIMSSAAAVVGSLLPQSDRAPFFLVASTFLLLMSARRLWIVIFTLNRVQYFDDYQAQLKKRWPDLALDN
jgi:hypothetical protein